MHCNPITIDAIPVFVVALAVRIGCLCRFLSRLGLYVCCLFALVVVPLIPAVMYMCVYIYIYVYIEMYVYIYI